MHLAMTTIPSSLIPLDSELSGLWGTDVVASTDASAPGWCYSPRPGSVVEMLAGVDRWVERTFLVQGQRRISVARFLHAVSRTARMLSHRHVSRGERVFIHVGNSSEFVLAVWATWWVGAVPVLGNWGWSVPEIEHAVDLTQPAFSMHDLDEPTPSGVAKRALMEGELTRNLEADANTEGIEPPARVDEASPALILFTSGSEGHSKAVVLSHRSVVANQHNLLLRSRKLPQQLDPNHRQEVLLATTPLFHIGGVSNLITQLIIGGRLVLTEGRFDAGEVLRLIESEGVHRWGGVPTMAIRVLEHPAFANHDLSSLRSFPLGGAPVPAALLNRLRRRLPQLRERGLVNTWGMTETGGFVTVAGQQDLARYPETVGRPYPVAELRIHEPDSAGTGEVLVRSPTVMLGYLSREDGAVDENGWLHTGDLGHINDDGYLFLEGRSKDIVIRGGENIACAHVERVLLEHPDVREAAVFGVPHRELGEELAAAVTVLPEASLTEAGLREFLRQTLAHFEIPSRWHIDVESLPTQVGGKVDKQMLTRMIGDAIKRT